MARIMSSWQRRYLQLALLSSAMASGLFSICGNGAIAIAQIIPDTTLPNNSTIRTIDNLKIIEGGTKAGGNLFHSFKEFSVPNGGKAHFNNSIDIQNIITRVTGGSISQIDGLIQANGKANVFILNPKGIIFGANASLNIGGSFFATTASSVKFADGFEFSAGASEKTPLLSISVPIGLQFGSNPGTIQVFGNSQVIRTTSAIIDTNEELRVQPDQTLALVGGDVSLEGATLKTAGGRIELGSVAGAGQISLKPNNKGYSLGYDGVQNLGQIQLSQLSAVNASGEGSGDVQVVAKHVTLTNGSQIEASTLGSKPPGAIDINATESLEVIGISANNSPYTALVALAYPNATAAAGNLTINTRKLLVRDGARVLTSTFGAGNGGNLTVNTRELLVRDGGQIGADTFGAGNGGNLTVNATKGVQLIGSSGNAQTLTSLSTSTEFNATGVAGNLTINTAELLVRDGGQIGAGTFGAGKGGNLTINATKGVQIIGASTDGNSGTILSTSTESNATGAAGNLTINTAELLVRDGAQISTGTSNAGNGGNLTVNATKGVQLIGRSANGKSASGLFTSSKPNATGAAGNLTINTAELLVRDAQINATTSGAGKGGNLMINATKGVQILGASGDARRLSVLSTSSQSNATGAGVAGNLTINTAELLVQDAQIGAGTFGSGNGGNLTVNASEKVEVIGRADGGLPLSGLFTSSQSNTTGAAGNLTIKTRQLLVRDGATVSVSSKGKGLAGNLEVNAHSISLNNNASLNAQTQSLNTDPNKEQATINLRSTDLVLRRGSKITTDATGPNVIGGNINIDTGVLAAIENSFISANSANSGGGRVRVNSQGIFGSRPEDAFTPSFITATGATPQLNGTIELNIKGINPTGELVQLPGNIVDVSRLMEQDLCLASQHNEFLITGRGGLPNSPLQTLVPDAGWEDWRILTPTQSHSGEQTVSVATANRNHKLSNIKDHQPETIVQATGWVMDSHGDVVLTANPVTVAPDNFWSHPPDCQTVTKGT